MQGVLVKIQRLIAIATHENAQAEEARTAAHIAARLIQGHGIELQDPAERPSGGAQAKTIRSRYIGRCTLCGGAYQVGELVKWTKGRGSAHATCFDP
ncbi:MAG TPA: DUF2786 domain-containing protein [Polyangiaceae bacterium]|nr:DUF2786 domain-containing protein [Polyangiaceae bacterium]